MIKRHSSPGFRKALTRAIHLMIDEIKDGCNECNDDGACREHSKIIGDILLHPRRYIEMKCVDGQWKSNAKDI